MRHIGNQPLHRINVALQPYDHHRPVGIDFQPTKREAETQHARLASSATKLGSRGAAGGILGRVGAREAFGLASTATDRDGFLLRGLAVVPVGRDAAGLVALLDTKAMPIAVAAANGDPRDRRAGRGSGSAGGCAYRCACLDRRDGVALPPQTAQERDIAFSGLGAIALTAIDASADAQRGVSLLRNPSARSRRYAVLSRSALLGLREGLWSGRIRPGRLRPARCAARRHQGQFPVVDQRHARVRATFAGFQMIEADTTDSVSGGQVKAAELIIANFDPR